MKVRNKAIRSKSRLSCDIDSKLKLLAMDAAALRVPSLDLTGYVELALLVALRKDGYKV